MAIEYREHKRIHAKLSDPSIKVLRCSSVETLNIPKPLNLKPLNPETLNP